MLARLRLAWHRWSLARKMERVFARGADPYRYRAAPYERARLDAMAAACGGRRWRRALEVGCAEGAFTERLLPLCESVTALDVSPSALARARAAAPGADFRLADARSWEPPARFDLVVLAEVVYYMDKPLVRDEFERFFARARGWVDPGGRLVLAHAFASPEEREIRRGYRERFEAAGFVLKEERVVEGPGSGGVACLLSVLE